MSRLDRNTKGGKQSRKDSKFVHKLKKFDTEKANGEKSKRERDHKKLATITSHNPEEKQVEEVFHIAILRFTQKPCLENFIVMAACTATLGCDLSEGLKNTV